MVWHALIQWNGIMLLALIPTPVDRVGAWGALVLLGVLVLWRGCASRAAAPLEGIDADDGKDAKPLAAFAPVFPGLPIGPPLESRPVEVRPSR